MKEETGKKKRDVGRRAGMYRCAGGCRCLKLKKKKKKKKKEDCDGTEVMTASGDRKFIG